MPEKFQIRKIKSRKVSENFRKLLLLLGIEKLSIWFDTKIILKVYFKLVFRILNEFF